MKSFAARLAARGIRFNPYDRSEVLGAGGKARDFCGMERCERGGVSRKEARDDISSYQGLRVNR
ncbi:MAG: hypothetical protein ACREC9_07350 [Methylocella sp.]